MAGDSGVRVPSTGRPKFVMVGIDRPDGTCRLYASRDLPGDIGFGQREVRDKPVTHIDADMADVLVIDGRSWADCFARAFEIWANRDRDAALSTGPVVLKNGVVLTDADIEALAVEAERGYDAGKLKSRGRVLDGPAHAGSLEAAPEGDDGFAED